MSQGSHERFAMDRLRKTRRVCKCCQRFCNEIWKALRGFRCWSEFVMNCLRRWFEVVVDLARSCLRFTYNTKWFLWDLAWDLRGILFGNIRDRLMLCCGPEVLLRIEHASTQDCLKISWSEFHTPNDTMCISSGIACCLPRNSIWIPSRTVHQFLRGCYAYHTDSCGIHLSEDFPRISWGYLLDSAYIALDYHKSFHEFPEICNDFLKNLLAIANGFPEDVWRTCYRTPGFAEELLVRPEGFP